MLTFLLYAGRSVTSCPSSRTTPSVGISKPPIMRRVVVLPQPDGPSMLKNSPRRISSVEPVDGDDGAKALDHLVEHDDRIAVRCAWRRLAHRCRTVGLLGSHGYFRYGCRIPEYPKTGSPPAAVATILHLRTRRRRPAGHPVFCRPAATPLTVRRKSRSASARSRAPERFARSARRARSWRCESASTYGLRSSIAHESTRRSSSKRLWPVTARTRSLVRSYSRSSRAERSGLEPRSEVARRDLSIGLGQAHLGVVEQHVEERP